MSEIREEIKVLFSFRKGQGEDNLTFKFVNKYFDLDCEEFEELDTIEKINLAHGLIKFAFDNCDRFECYYSTYEENELFDKCILLGEKIYISLIPDSAPVFK